MTHEIECAVDVILAVLSGDLATVHEELDPNVRGRGGSDLGTDGVPLKREDVSKCLFLLRV